ncbi:MAG: hypothetical protein EZS28_003511 [Streblomastix strix]|uniref:HECT domain-containing protein n=1 Tax=Streblomastix strix TaxID=222440 RepID=A0A5J4X125_9EUKA|nr:MAG: hypothetical protein EZS28_003511 [Streblomastix strix]
MKLIMEDKLNFIFLNRVLIKVLKQDFQVETHFSHLRYKSLIDLSFLLSDLEPIDADAYQQLVFIIVYDPSVLMLDYELQIIEFDQMKVYELTNMEKY